MHHPSRSLMISNISSSVRMIEYMKKVKVISSFISNIKAGADIKTRGITFIKGKNYLIGTIYNDSTYKIQVD